ncbi:MAG: transposase [Ignavibacteria bacterium]|nr:transposase [Ignavibacteria bacterium]
MPARNTIKTYAEDTYYHIYNRGVEKRNLFLDENDYLLFLHLLKIYLSSPQKTDSPLVTRRDLVRPRPARSLSEEVRLSAYCLMPNHFHLLLLQKTKDGMTKLMRKISTTYAMYFNEKYDRVGTLFESPYKAIGIDSEHYLLHLSRYIHLNPTELTKLTRRDLVSYPYSSYAYYLGKKHAGWLNPSPVLSYFHSGGKSILKGVPSYQEFVESYQSDPAEVLGSLTLE